MWSLLSICKFIDLILGLKGGNLMALSSKTGLSLNMGGHKIKR